LVEFRIVDLTISTVSRSCHLRCCRELAGGRTTGDEPCDKARPELPQPLMSGLSLASAAIARSNLAARRSASLPEVLETTVL